MTGSHAWEAQPGISIAVVTRNSGSPGNARIGNGIDGLEFLDGPAGVVSERIGHIGARQYRPLEERRICRHRRSGRTTAALHTALTMLRLSGLAQALEVRLQEASGNRPGHAEFLELVLQDELAIRNERLVARRLKAVV